MPKENPKEISIAGELARFDAEQRQIAREAEARASEIEKHKLKILELNRPLAEWSSELVSLEQTASRIEAALATARAAAAEWRRVLKSALLSGESDGNLGYARFKLNPEQFFASELIKTAEPTLVEVRQKIDHVKSLVAEYKKRHGIA